MSCYIASLSQYHAINVNYMLLTQILNHHNRRQLISSSINNSLEQAA